MRSFTKKDFIFVGRTMIRKKVEEIGVAKVEKVRRTRAGAIMGFKKELLIRKQPYDDD